MVLTYPFEAKTSSSEQQISRKFFSLILLYPGHEKQLLMLYCTITYRAFTNNKKVITFLTISCFAFHSNAFLNGNPNFRSCAPNNFCSLKQSVLEKVYCSAGKTFCSKVVISVRIVCYSTLCYNHDGHVSRRVVIVISRFEF